MGEKGQVDGALKSVFFGKERSTDQLKKKKKGEARALRVFACGPWTMTMTYKKVDGDNSTVQK